MPYVVYPVLVRYTLTDTVTLEVFAAVFRLFCVIVILYLILSLVVDIAFDVAIISPPYIFLNERFPLLLGMKAKLPS